MEYLKYIVLIVILSSCKSVDINQEVTKATWIKEAFITLESQNYPKIKAISWWHENFDNSKLRIDSSNESLQAYQNGVSSTLFTENLIFQNNKLIVNEQKIYHAAFPDFGAKEDIVTTQRITNFESLATKNIAWAYFSYNWYEDIHFPENEINTIVSLNKTPFIRLMPRTFFQEYSSDPNYTMQNIIDGNFDNEITQWAVDAKNTNTNLLIEFGTEVNGSWFSWNGLYNGANTTTEYGDPTLADGPERFKDAYIHIIDIFNDEEANNITWFFHVDAYNEPTEDWNSIRNYYPGDDYIDWLGVSIYGAQTAEQDNQTFEKILNDVYSKLTALSNKPIAILEFAVNE